MTDDPKPDRDKRPDPGERQNAQGDHEGVAHSPEDFDVLNPQKQVPGNRVPSPRPPTPEDTR